MVREIGRMTSLEMEAPCSQLDSRLECFSVFLFPQRALFESGIADFPPKHHCQEGKALARNNEQNPGLID